VKLRVRPFAPAYGAALLAALAGSLVVVRIAEPRLDERRAANEHLRIAIDEAVTAAAERAATAAAVERLHHDLAPELVARDGTARTAGFVRDTARFAARHRTRVAAIVPAARVLRPGVPASAAAALPEPAYDLTLEGRYVDLLATLRALAALRPPSNVDLIALTRKNPNAPDATLIASLRVNLARFIAQPDGGSAASP